jgi:hypothetical protein
LTDFLIRLTEPSFEAHFTSDMAGVLEEVDLPDLLKNALQSKNSNLIRFYALQELERASFSPNISQHIRSTDDLTDAFPQNEQQSGYPAPSYPYNQSSPTNVDWHPTISPPTIENTVVAEGKDRPQDVETYWTREPRQAVDAAIAYFENRDKIQRRGALYIVGTGIKPLKDLTSRAEARIRSADCVFYCVADPMTERRIHEMNKSARSLYDLYGNDKLRIDTYQEMVDCMLAAVREDKVVCGYGHPGVFAWAPHESIKIARNEGFRAEMAAGVSTQDCLLADLGIDPARCGLQTFDATDVLVRRRVIDTTCHVLLWQIDCVGDSGFNFRGYRKHNVPILVERLLEFYPKEHTCVIYVSQQVPHVTPKIDKIAIEDLDADRLTGVSTLYIPPARAPAFDFEMARRLGLQ